MGIFGPFLSRIQQPIPLAIVDSPVASLPSPQVERTEKRVSEGGKVHFSRPLSSSVRFSTISLE